jgi:UDP-N-acetylglucosamine diphosphorylase/glucosamine-1-phosphate N-acetyltransferase
MNIVIFEDKPESFYPLVNLFPQFSLRIGMYTIAEHTTRCFSKWKVHYIARAHFGLNTVKPKEKTLYISSRLLLKKMFPESAADSRLNVGAETIGFVKHDPPFPCSIEEIADALTAIKRSKQVPGEVLCNPWDLLTHNETMLRHDFGSMRKNGRAPKGVYIKGDKKNIYVARSATVHKMVFLDVSDGPIYIDEGAVVGPFSTIVGPTYIGPKTVVEHAKVIRSVIGPHCRIGGEVEACIFQGYANKHHEGFLGHSFVGEWVNLGALTTNSDLKNNYGPVRLTIGKKEFDTGLMKLGCFIGDHTKLGIGTLIPTGAVIGSFVNFAGGGMIPRFTPSFRWLTPGKEEYYDLGKAISTAKVVMERRDVKMSKQYERMIRTLHGQIRRSD